MTLMSQEYFADYYWKRGRPVGVKTGGNFKIVADPYFKRIAIEQYEEGKFVETVYDSALFDFRHLRQEEALWQREALWDKGHTMLSLIRNGDDRVILSERAHFLENTCQSCELLSPHGVLVGEQVIIRRSLGGAFDGVILYDKLGRPVLVKRYRLNEEGEFGELFEEISELPPEVSAEYLRRSSAQTPLG